MTKTCASYSVIEGTIVQYAGYYIGIGHGSATVAIFTVGFLGQTSPSPIHKKPGDPPTEIWKDGILQISVQIDFIFPSSTPLRYMVSFHACTELDITDQPPTPTPTPTPTPITSPEIEECVFPTLSLNFISVMSGLASWLGCMIRNLITLIKWVVDWLLHFPDHLDAWISRLFGVDPALPFFDEVLKKIDVWISGKFGVDPSLPFWEELVKKALAWIAEVINTSAQNRIQERKW